MHLLIALYFVPELLESLYLARSILLLLHPLVDLLKPILQVLILEVRTEELLVFVLLILGREVRAQIRRPYHDVVFAFVVGVVRGPHPFELEIPDDFGDEHFFSKLLCFALLLALKISAACWAFHIELIDHVFYAAEVGVLGDLVG